MYEWTFSWIGGVKKASGRGGAGSNTANGEEEPWNGINTYLSGFTMMTINARIMVWIGKEEMTTMLKRNEHYAQLRTLHTSLVFKSFKSVIVFIFIPALTDCAGINVGKGNDASLVAREIRELFSNF